MYCFAKSGSDTPPWTANQKWATSSCLLQTPHREIQEIEILTATCCDLRCFHRKCTLLTRWEPFTRGKLLKNIETWLAYEMRLHRSLIFIEMSWDNTMIWLIVRLYGPYCLALVSGQSSTGHLTERDKQHENKTTNKFVEKNSKYKAWSKLPSIVTSLAVKSPYKCAFLLIIFS